MTRSRPTCHGLPPQPFQQPLTMCLFRDGYQNSAMTDIDLEPAASAESGTTVPVADKLKTVGTLEQLKSLLERKYPKLEKEGIGEVVTLLPGGQLINLWRTLHHNLHVACVQDIVAGTETKEQRTFFSVLVEYCCDFLENVKVADNSIPIVTMEKVSDMMSKLRDECLAPLGTSLLKRKHDARIVTPFLRLAYTWSQLHGLLLHYNNEKYKGSPPTLSSNPSYFNLSYLHPYLSSKNWIKLATQIESADDSTCTSLLIDLVVQKLKYMTVFEKSVKAAEDDAHKLLSEHHIKECSNYLLSKPHINSSQEFSNEVYSLVSPNIAESNIIALTSQLVKQFPLPCEDEKPVKNYCAPEDTKLHYSLVLETLIEIMRKVAKMKLQKMHMKKLINEVLSIEKRSVLIFQSADIGNIVDKAGKDQKKEILTGLLNITNELIEEFSSQPEADCSEFSTDLILPTLQFLCKLPLEDYSKTLKTVVFHSIFSVLLALANCGDQNVLNLLMSALTQCTTNVQGNEFIFLISWSPYFQWFLSHVDCFSLKAQRQCTLLIVQNIYVSSKSVLEFENDLDTFGKKSKMNSIQIPVVLYVLEYLIVVLGEHVKSKSKDKLTTHIQNHIRKLTRFVVNSLKSHTKSKKNLVSDSTRTNANTFHACWLAESAEEVLASVKTTPETEEEVNPADTSTVVQPYIETALSLLETKDEVIEMMDVDDVYNSSVSLTELKISKSYALAFLRCVCKSKESIPAEFITKLWTICIKFGCMSWVNLPTDGFGEIPMISPKDIYEAASVDEFAGITSLLESELSTQSSMEKPDEMKMESLVRLLDEILEVQLSPEKKDMRRKFIENVLLTSLAASLHWNATESCINKMIVPFLQFEANLLRRRNAMCGTNSLSLCLTSITSVPLNAISDIKEYRKVFCILGDLLNAFTVHRLDVLSFKMPVYLQCFQYVVESITLRADQSNKLTDDEIRDLKYCAHSIERICQSAKLGQKEFSRVSPYFIAILMRQFEMFTVYPAVKDALLNGCYKLLDLCDNHGISQLNSMFTLGSREIFKTVHELYRKFYRYSGKV